MEYLKNFSRAVLHLKINVPMTGSLQCHKYIAEITYFNYKVLNEKTEIAVCFHTFTYRGLNKFYNGSIQFIFMLKFS